MSVTHLKHGKFVDDYVHPVFPLSSSRLQTAREIRHNCVFWSPRNRSRLFLGKFNVMLTGPSSQIPRQRRVPPSYTKFNNAVLNPRNAVAGLGKHFFTRQYRRVADHLDGNFAIGDDLTHLCNNPAVLAKCFTHRNLFPAVFGGKILGNEGRVCRLPIQSVMTCFLSRSSACLVSSGSPPSI